MTDTERLDWLDRFAGLARGPCAQRTLTLWNTAMTLAWIVEVDNCMDMEDYAKVEVVRETGGIRAAIDAAIAALDGCDGTVQKCIDTDACKASRCCIARHIPQTYAEFAASLKRTPK